MAQNIHSALFQLFNADGTPVSGGKFAVYEPGTTTPIALYSDEALSTPIANPIVADASGVFAQAFVGDSYTRFKVVLMDADDVELYSRDPVFSLSRSDSFAASSVTFDGSGIGFSATNVQDAIEESLDYITESPTFIDTADNTKELTFDLSNITTATERTVTWPDVSGTVMVSGANFTTSGSFTFSGGGLFMADNTVSRAEMIDYSETVNAIGSIGGGTQDIDLEDGNVVSATVDTAETTFTFSNPPAAGTCGSFTLVLTNGGSQTVNWPASVDWSRGSAPTLTSSGVDILTFFTIDGGTIWFGFLSGVDMG